MAEAERVGIASAALIAGLPKRTLQALASEGAIPGVAMPAGRWTFDVADLRRWARNINREHRPCRTSISAAASGRRASRSPASNTEKAYERVFAPTRNAG